MKVLKHDLAFNKTLAIIGAGAIANEVIKRLPAHIRLTHIISTQKSLAKVKAMYQNVNVVESINEIIDIPDYIIECAGHEAVKIHAPDILSRGSDLYVISTGVFAEEGLYESMQLIASRNKCKLHLLSGAIAGMDGLRAARQIHLSPNPISVIYHSIKPTKGWKGTHAEHLVELEKLTETTCFFKGSAREAARLFPQNANVAATIALNGIGFDDTQVVLNACPSAKLNQHYIDIKGDFGQITLTLNGYPLPNNPKTSFLTALSILQVLDK